MEHHKGIAGVRCRLHTSANGRLLQRPPETVPSGPELGAVVQSMPKSITRGQQGATPLGAGPRPQGTAVREQATAYAEQLCSDRQTTRLLP